MATLNPFDLLDDDAEDPSQLAVSVAADKSKKSVPVSALPAKSAPPSKQLPPAQAVRETRSNAPRGGGRGGGGGGDRGFSRGRGGPGGYNRDFRGGDGPGGNNGYSGGYSKPSEEGDVSKSSYERRGGGDGGPPRGGFRGGRRGGSSNEDGEGERPRRTFERRSGTGYSGGYSKPSEEGDVSKSSYERRGGGYGGPPRGGFRGGRRGGSSNEDGEGERPRRTFERRSGTGRGGDFKREGSGRGNWGTPGEEVFVGETEEGVETEKDAVEKPAADDVAADANKENTAEVEEQKEPEDKEMTLDEYEKILEEKKKALQSQNTSERKVDTKVFESMQQLSNKKTNDEIFIKLGSDKDKRKDDKEEKAKKAVSITEFLKPAEGENYYRGGRGGRGRGGRDRGGVSSGGFGGKRSEAAPAIGDTAQFPSLGGK